MDVFSDKIVTRPLPAVGYPFIFEGITDDEACFENYYLHFNSHLIMEDKYEPLIKQLLDGKIEEIPTEYLKLSPSFINDSNWRYTKETYYQNHTDLPSYM